METNYKVLTDVMTKNHIKPSHHRIKVLGYLMANRTHPTVDMIYHDLHEEIPTLSKSTVYNTLNAFVKANIVRPVTIEETEIRYDINVEDHGHFRCNRCGRIFDFSIRLDDIEPAELKGYQVRERSVYFDGVCRSCLQDQSK